MRKEPDRFAVNVVAGSDPEKFVITGATAGPQIETMHFFSEKELRDFLDKAGLPEAEVEGMIQNARKNPQ